MEKAFFKENLLKLEKKKNIFLMLTILFCVANMFQSALLFSKKERIVVVPTSGSQYTLGDEVDLEGIASYLANIYLNKSPADAASKYKHFLQHVHHSHYHDLKRLLEEEHKTMLKNHGMSITFRPQTTYLDKEKLLYVLEGDRIVTIGTAGERPTVTESGQKRYYFKFKRQGDRFVLISLKQEDLN